MQKRTLIAWGIAGLALAGAAALAPAPATAELVETTAGPVEVTPIVTGLDNPWSVAFLSEGCMLITERDGKLLAIDTRAGTQRAVEGVPEVYASGQGGLFDVVPDPAFSVNRRLYLSFAARGERGAHTVLAAATLSPDGSRLTGLRRIFEQRPVVSGSRHFGGRIVPDGNGNLFLTTGDRGDRPEAQANGHIGKIIRVTTEGGVPADNPDWAGRFPPEVWSVGHRNPQGAALDEAGRLWTSSHGARGGDEVNRPQAGLNYGWPVISYGRHYSGGKIGEGTDRPGMEQPLWYWDPSIAPSGMMIYSGKLWPAWRGDIFIGSLKFDHLSRLDRQGDRIAGEERLFPDRYVRIRDVREAPDGTIWFLAVGDGTLYRVSPAR